MLPLAKSAAWAAIRAAIQAGGRAVYRGSLAPGTTPGQVKIKTTEEASISIRKVYTVTTVQVGYRSHNFEKERNRVKVYLRHDGYLKIDNM